MRGRRCVRADICESSYPSRSFGYIASRVNSDDKGAMLSEVHERD